MAVVERELGGLDAGATVKYILDTPVVTYNSPVYITVSKGTLDIESASEVKPHIECEYPLDVAKELAELRAALLS